MKVIRNLLIVIAVIVTVLFFALNPILKKIITEYGSESLKTAVTVGEVQSSVKDIKLTIKDIGVKNPAGFSGKNILNIGNLVINMSSDSGSHLIVVDEFSLSNVGINIEQNASGVNIKTLVDNLRSNDLSDRVDDSYKDDQVHNPQKIIINKFSINNAHVDLISELLNESVDIPVISLANVGGNSGIEISNLAPHIVQILIREAEKVLKKQGIDAVKGKLEKTITRKVSEKLGLEANTLDDVKEQLQEKTDDISHQLKEQTNEIKDKLKKIFKF